MNKEAILKEQQDEWPFLVKAGREGNPFATLCFHCYGRHKPPYGPICPNEPPPNAHPARV